MTEQHWSVRIAMGVITPDVDVAFRTALRCPASPLEPGMESAGVIHHQIHHHFEALTMGCGQHPMKRGQVTEIWMDRGEIGDVIAPVLQR